VDKTDSAKVLSLAMVEEGGRNRKGWRKKSKRGQKVEELDNNRCVGRARLERDMWRASVRTGRMIVVGAAGATMSSSACGISRRIVTTVRL